MNEAPEPGSREADETTVAARLDEHDRLLAALRDMLTQSAQDAEEQQALLERLARGIDQPPGNAPATKTGQDQDGEAPEWSGWADHASSGEWADLADWVDWLGLTYGLRSQPIHPCWPLHGGAVEELAALWMAWQQASGSSQVNDWEGDEALAYWHDRYLPGALDRLQRLYSLADCRGTEHEDTAGKPRPTDRAGIVVHPTGEAPYPPARAGDDKPETPEDTRQGRHAHA